MVPTSVPGEPTHRLPGALQAGSCLGPLCGSQPSQPLGSLPAGGSWLGENTTGKEGRAGRSPWGVGRQEQTEPASFLPWGQSPVWAFLMPPEMLVPGCELQALLGSRGCAVPKRGCDRPKRGCRLVPTHPWWCGGLVGFGTRHSQSEEATLSVAHSV